jgi:undecaprenyl-diphosphatase
MNAIEEQITIYLQKTIPINIIHFLDVISSFLYTKYTIIVLIIGLFYNIITIKQILGLLLLHLSLTKIKHFFKKPRPFTNNQEIKNYDTSIVDEFSFPSGHSTLSFLIFFILYDNHRINKYFVIIPLLIAFSRIVLGVHYISDVIAGALLAKLISLILK